MDARLRCHRLNRELVAVLADYARLTMRRSWQHYGQEQGQDPAEEEMLLPDSLRSNLCTGMYRELARFVVERPANYLCGLRLLSELLPAPLPLPAPPAATAQLAQLMLAERKNLGDHLEALLLPHEPTYGKCILSFSLTSSFQR